ncbi:Argininosuccinate synthase [Providencia rustigianii]|uniref:Alkylhydroperoxidase AhpD family core domain protein n=2 Tax=Providencia rustigianii TaxID=158850 RepID=D1NZN3_9GAMM|nr:MULTISPECIES: carboxymuconolactone decarboxylase family protein [Providencia]EFB73299.1 alkylhydroperoxidase AhpD family core domain protein [Providencia rustigianii DSM 4541]MTC57056.1 carboxymuconolactone decarboxylase family protein [Providencia rustigianii]SPY77171.1 Argininosuccinate synthase [Providencia rustigianii]SUC26521.1 Argininosuccinate synthase [Providencia rustigianii]SUC35118.1 Argininosuccinate synthase [Providencia rustigianii]
MSRVSLSKKSPNAYSKLIEISNHLDEQAVSVGLEEGFIHLLKLRVSQINGCAFCVRLHTQDAQKCQISIDKIALVPVWKEADYFTEKEKAAFLLVESVNMVHDGHISNDIYENAAKYWSEDQLALIEWISITIGAFNRIAIASRYSVKP